MCGVVCGVAWSTKPEPPMTTLKCEGVKHSLSDAILYEDNNLKLHFDIFFFSSARFLLQQIEAALCFCIFDHKE